MWWRGGLGSNALKLFSLFIKERGLCLSSTAHYSFIVSPDKIRECRFDINHSIDATMFIMWRGPRGSNYSAAAVCSQPALTVRPVLGVSKPFCDNCHFNTSDITACTLWPTHTMYKHIKYSGRKRINNELSTDISASRSS